MDEYICGASNNFFIRNHLTKVKIYNHLIIIALYFIYPSMLLCNELNKEISYLY
jgi:hypothetical protein